jgi:hypothetical protein
VVVAVVDAVVVGVVVAACHRTLTPARDGVWPCLASP